ncbi:MAG: methenyltetrahydrofolate cyclohydrolase [Euryarchaeota archaeon]|nr:methenyltetrahydrofolate cyclohydrolase [Euryarchaeota archaeon]
MKKPWVEMSIRDFQSALASSSPTPGGGTAAAIALGQAAALSIMVCDLTIGSEKWKDGWVISEKLLPISIEIMTNSARLADEDSDSFDAVMNSFKMPKESEEEKESRRQEIRKNTLVAAKVPMETAELALELLNHLPDLAKYGNKNAISDVGVCSLLASAACKGALFNVKINLSSLPEGYAEDLENKALQVMEECRLISRKIMDIVNDNL